MSNEVIAQNVSPSNAPGKGLNVALWVVQGLLALGFVGSASGKLLGQPETVGLFDAIGVGQCATHLFVLHNAPTAAVVLLALVSFVLVLWGRRAELARLLGRS